MTPHKLMEAVVSKQGAPVSNTIFSILAAAQHFDAGCLEDIPWGSNFIPDVKPPFQATTVLARGKDGESFLFGCLDGSDVDGRWHCFAAVDTPNGPAVSLFGFCPKTFDLTVPSAPHGVADAARHGSSVLNQFFAVIACSNVRVVDIPAPAALNKKRVKNGKPPISSHKVLHLVAPTSYSKSENQGGTHNSPRVHLRRGHIRKLPSGVTVWIQQCVVGSKHGMVTKDYAVSYAAAAA